jgi:hypothetical protein
MPLQLPCTRSQMKEEEEEEEETLLNYIKDGSPNGFRCG